MIEQSDIDRLKEIFVTRKECDDVTESLKSKLSNDSVRLAVIESKLGTITWLPLTKRIFRGDGIANACS